MSSRADRPRRRPRRALSSARRGGRIESGGEPRLAAALARSLEAPQRERVVHESLTHPLHSYPARMHPATARDLVELVLETEAVEPRSVLDPFCGSGTTLVEARSAGAEAVGVDLNPLAVLLARVKTWTAPRARRSELLRRGRELAAATIAEGRAARRSGYEPPPLRAPKGVDPAARDRALIHWFPAHVRRELEFLAARIEEVVADDAEVGEALEACLSAIVVKASRRASDTDPSRVDKRVGRGAPARWFRERVELLCAGLDDLARERSAPPGRAVLGDARDLAASGIGDGSFGAVVTSPPYAGTYDYASHHDLRLAFLGLPLAPLESGEIGARRAFETGGGRRAFDRVRSDMGAAFAAMARALAPGGLAAIVIGDSLAGRSAVWADELVRDAARDHFERLAWAWQERPKLGGAERRAFGDAPKREHVLLLARR